MSRYFKQIVEYNRPNGCGLIARTIMSNLREEADRHGVYSVSNNRLGIARFQESAKLPPFDIVVSGYGACLESEILRVAMPSAAKRVCQDMWRYIFHEDLHIEGGRVYCSIKARLDTMYGDAAYDRLLRELYGKFEEYYRAFNKEILPKLQGVPKSQIIWYSDRRQKKAS